MYNKQSVPKVTNTWIFIDFTHRIKKNSKRFIQILDRDLVLWRTNNGVLSLFDAYCPHLGGNFSYGQVCGEELQCNYHKKKFNTLGICHGLTAKANSYPLQVINNMLFAWIGNHTPTWQMPDFLTGYRKSSHCKWKILRTAHFHFKYHPRNAGENSADANHFKTFHKMCDTYEPSEIIEKTDHNLICRIKMQGSSLWSNKIKQDIELEVNSIGPCTVIIDSYVKVKQREFCYKFVYLCTPTVGDNTDFTVNTAIRVAPKDENDTLFKRISYYIFANISFFLSIYEFWRESKKVFEPKSNYWYPNITQQESVIQEYYDWYRRFYRDDKRPEEL